MNTLRACSLKHFYFRILLVCRTSLSYDLLTSNLIYVKWTRCKCIHWNIFTFELLLDFYKFYLRLIWFLRSECILLLSIWKFILRISKYGHRIFFLLIAASHVKSRRHIAWQIVLRDTDGGLPKAVQHRGKRFTIGSSRLACISPAERNIYEPRNDSLRPARFRLARVIAGFRREFPPSC